MPSREQPLPTLALLGVVAVLCLCAAGRANAEVLQYFCTAGAQGDSYTACGTAFSSDSETHAGLLVVCRGSSSAAGTSSCTGGSAVLEYSYSLQSGDLVVGDDGNWKSSSGVEFFGSEQASAWPALSVEDGYQIGFAAAGLWAFCWALWMIRKSIQKR